MDFAGIEIYIYQEINRFLTMQLKSGNRFIILYPLRCIWGGICMATRTKLIIALSIFGILDVVIPIPILGIILLYVVFQRPPWFRDAVNEIYIER
jgi:hypothetical protein